MNTTHQPDVLQTRIKEAERLLHNKTRVRNNTENIQLELEHLLNSLKTVRHESLKRGELIDLE